jgi:hypothetical protein
MLVFSGIVSSESGSKKMQSYAPQHQRSRAGSSGNAKPCNSLMRSSRPSGHLHSALGNQALQRLLQSEPAGVETRSHANPATSIQPKLKVGSPGDSFEREADSVANQVMNMPALSRQQLQMKSTGQDELSAAAPPIVHDVLHSSGQPLDAQTRGFMESRFGYDFSDVKLHTDARAAKSAQALNANAYTVGQHIALGEGQYSPQTPAGKQLLAHELTHVVHQSGGSSGAPTLQRQPQGQAKPTKNYPFSVTTKGCNGSEQSPFKEDQIKAAAKAAFEKARDGNCIKNESLKDKILAGYDGLEITCKDDAPEDKCAETVGMFFRSIDLYKTAYNSSKCPDLEVSIFHEVVHFAQSIISPHGDISWDCQDACYPDSDKHEPKRGTASGCNFQRGLLPFFGVSRGKTLGGPSASYLRFYAGYEKRRWIASFIDVDLGLSLSFIGETETGQPRNVSPGGTLALFTSAFRFDPGKFGGFYASTSGGVGLAKQGSKFGMGAEVLVGGGVRWRMLDLSINAGANFDVTRETGLNNFSVAATLTFSPQY